LNINVCVTFVKPFIFAGIQRVKIGLFYKSNSQSFVDTVGGLFIIPWNTE